MGRSLTATTLATVLVATTTLGVVGAQPSNDPPFYDPEFRVTVDWDHMKDLAFEYTLTNSPEPVEQPRLYDYVTDWGGCPGSEADGRAVNPLVLTDRREDGFWISGWPTEYVLVITPAGVCSRYKDRTVWETAERIKKKKPNGVKVWATVEAWASDADGQQDRISSEIIGPIRVPIHAERSDFSPDRRRFTNGFPLPAVDADGGSGSSVSRPDALSDDSLGLKLFVVIWALLLSDPDPSEEHLDYEARVGKRLTDIILSVMALSPGFEPAAE